MRFSGVRLCLVFGFIILCVYATGPNDSCRQRKTCWGKEHDPSKSVCCGKELHQGTGLSCCGQQAFNPDGATCCKKRQGSAFKANVTQGLPQSRNVSACCGLAAYNPLNEMCCQSRVVAKPVLMAKCCGEGAFDVENQRCCGPEHDKRIVAWESHHHQCCGHSLFDTRTQCCCWTDNISQIESITSNCCPENRGWDSEKHLNCGENHNKTILIPKSSNHRCCGHEQYDTTTECCCWDHDSRTIEPLGSSCCPPEPGVQLQTSTRETNCPEPHTGLCGAVCYNSDELQCCERSQTQQPWRCHSGHHAPTPVIFNPLTHICCNGCLSRKKPWMDKRSPGQHCCGTGLYQPRSEICCDGHRHPREEHSQCCGISAYNVNDLQMMCCGGTLYNLTSLGRSGHDTLCCGSILQNKLKQVCCSSEDTELLYAKKTKHKCCGHAYYNTSLWSCCAEKLSPVQQPGQHQDENATECTFLSLNNLNKRNLCNKIRIGTVQSVSLHSIVFDNVLEIQGTQATVEALRSPYILEMPNRCIFPKLSPGKTYFFDDAEVFSDFNHDAHQSIHFIMIKCLHS